MLWWVLQAALMIAAQQSQVPIASASETIDVDIVEIDAVVLDAHGKPVPGLTEKDFEVRVGGRRRPISNFYAVDRTLEQASAPAAPTTPEVTPAVARHDYLVLFIDDMHLQQFRRKSALDALRKFAAAHVRPGTAAMLVRWNGNLQIVRRFTEDAASIESAVDAIAREPAKEVLYDSDRRDALQMIEDLRNDPKLMQNMVEVTRQKIASLAGEERQRNEATIAALDQVVGDVTGLDGRRVLVYVSDGLPMQPAVEIWENFKSIAGQSSDPAAKALEQMQPLDAQSVDTSAQFLGFARRAAVGGVQIFAIDAHGVGPYDDFMRGRSIGMRLDSSLIRSNVQGPLKLLADETGGQAITDLNSMDMAFAQLGDHLSTYYSLGIRSDNSDREETVDVRVKKRGLTVRAGKHIRQRSTREQIADRVRAALYTRIEDNPLGANVAVAAAGGAKPGVDAVIRVPVPKLSIQPDATAGGVAYAVFVAMLDQENRQTAVRMFVHRVRPAESEESVQQLNLQAEPGTYTMSFAIVDGYSWQASYLQRDITIPK